MPQIFLKARYARAATRPGAMRLRLALANLGTTMRGRLPPRCGCWAAGWRAGRAAGPGICSAVGKSRPIAGAHMALLRHALLAAMTLCGLAEEATHTGSFKKAELEALLRAERILYALQMSCLPAPH